MKLSQIIIGTSGWGSRIGFKKSKILGNELINLGIINFDTAPNYGSGYSHHILNSLSKLKKLNVDTKFGDLVAPTPKEILKRIYRFNDLNSFIRSFKYCKTNKQIRFNYSFWNIDNIMKNIRSYFNDLKSCNIKTLYLHSPPDEIINRDLLKKLTESLSLKKIKLGVSSPEEKCFNLIINEFPEVITQVSFDFFVNNKKKIINKLDNVYINRLFKSQNNINKKTNFPIDYFKEIFQDKKNYRIIVGINSKKSISKLNDFLK
tara:strand:- start:6453 stop:7235 length:783 start_codon:yes stop_codon:yes gene_type:complete